MDMCRKFIQMGMTRAKRYANHAGGRKYSKVNGAELPKSSTHKDAKDKLEASEIFREVWNQCRDHEGYKKKKEMFQKEQKEWDKEKKKREKDGTSIQPTTPKLQRSA
ncbi:cytoplasmic protein [Neofusicoccum parvum]|nr:cytoplasmic protein [Neofusicoccum parvum]